MLRHCRYAIAKEEQHVMSVTRIHHLVLCVARPLTVDCLDYGGWCLVSRRWLCVLCGTGSR